MARHGWNSEIEVGKFLAALMKMTGAKSVVEIGVFEGETSAQIITALPKDGVFIGIDIEDLRAEKNKLLFSHGTKSISFIQENSLTVLKKKLPSDAFDLIFVDGNHDWAHVLPEFKLIERVMKVTGLIVYHDSLHIEGPMEIVKYASQYGYQVVNLFTPEMRGLAILQRK